MLWVHLVVALVLLHMFVMGFIVAKARDTYGVKAPATTGHEGFERYYRAQMNGIEQGVIMIPAILLAAQYWAPYLMALLGLIYLIGRIFYVIAYVNAKPRTIPFMMGLIPVLIFILAAIAGTVRAML